MLLWPEAPKEVRELGPPAPAQPGESTTGHLGLFSPNQQHTPVVTAVTGHLRG